MSDEIAIHTKLLRPHAELAGLYAIPIGILGGLMGLGGAEFRLPVLIAVLSYSVRQAIPLNLLISFVTLSVALSIRYQNISLEILQPILPIIGAMITGGLLAAFFGTALTKHLSKSQLELTIMLLLGAIGILLIIEGFLPNNISALFPESLVWKIACGVVMGLLIGLVSSMLGVAGGELIIPTLIFGYGLEIKLAGTASLIIALPIVLMGLVRHYRAIPFPSKMVLTNTILPMSIGTILGASLGALLVGIIASGFLKIALGLILVSSALKTFQHLQRAHTAPPKGT